MPGKGRTGVRKKISRGYRTQVNARRTRATHPEAVALGNRRCGKHAQGSLRACANALNPVLYELRNAALARPAASSRTS